MLADIASGERFLRNSQRFGDVQQVIHNLRDIIKLDHPMIVPNLLQGVRLTDTPPSTKPKKRGRPLGSKNKHHIRKKDNDLRLARKALKDGREKGTTPIEAIVVPKKRGRPLGSKNK
jgi:hypothetical protein